ncbi:hypothetical protein Efla_001494 [Eimeria flavescens]
MRINSSSSNSGSKTARQEIQTSACDSTRFRRVRLRLFLFLLPLFCLLSAGRHAGSAAAPPPQGEGAANSTSRREHLKDSLCAHFALHERRRKMPAEAALHLKACSEVDLNRLRSDPADSSSYEPQKTRQAIREASGGLQELLAESSQATRSKAVFRLLIAWAPACLQSLRANLPALIEGLSEKATLPLEVFGGSDPAFQRQKTLLRGGVFIRDRVGDRELLQEDRLKATIDGRNTALWLFARSLGLHAKLGLSLSACFANCRHRLRRKLLDGARSLQGAYYGALSTDILTLTVDKNQERVSHSE